MSAPYPDVRTACALLLHNATEDAQNAGDLDAAGDFAAAHVHLDQPDGPSVVDDPGPLLRVALSLLWVAASDAKGTPAERAIEQAIRLVAEAEWQAVVREPVEAPICGHVLRSKRGPRSAPCKRAPGHRGKHSAWPVALTEAP